MEKWQIFRCLNEFVTDRKNGGNNINISFDKYINTVIHYIDNPTKSESYFSMLMLKI